MERHGIEFTHDDPDRDYCTWKCECGKFSRINDIDWSYMLAATHISMEKERARNESQVQAR